MAQIVIEAGDEKIMLEVEFSDNVTARTIAENLPIESSARLWGDEIYFDTGLSAPVVDETSDVAVGDFAYWPQGKCLCIFFGPTPASKDEKPVPASAVVVVGKSKVDPDVLRKVKSGASILVSE